MKRTLSNRPVAAIVAVFTIISAWLLHGNPFGTGTISWPVALVVAFVGNCFLAYLLAAWAAPYLASTGGQSGAEDADPATRPTTVVGITMIAGDIGEEYGFWAVLEILASINIFVGIFNLFPMLPFDGGHAAIATYERIRSRGGRVYRANVEKLWPVTVAVLGLLLFLTFTGLYLDITRPF